MAPDPAPSPAPATPLTAPGPVFLVVLALVTFVGPLSIHLFFPAVPTVKAHYAVDAATVQLAVSLPLFAMAVMTLVFGSVSDRYGRRPALLGGLALFVAGSAIATAAASIEMLIAGRLIQAAGGACGLALSRAIARDVYGTDRLVRAIAYLTMAYALGPMVAAPVAGLLIDLSGWRAVVGFATLAGLALAVLAFVVIHETRPVGSGFTARSSYLADYLRLFGSLRFTCFVVQSGASSGAFFTLATGAALLMSEYLGRPAAQYGLYFLFFPFGYLAGNFLASRLGGRVPIETMVLASSLLLAATIAVQGGLVLGGIVTPLTIMAPGFMVTFSQGVGLANAQTGAMRIAADLAGTAAGIGVFLQLFAASAFTQIYGLVADGTPAPLIAVLAAAAVLGLAAGTVTFGLRRPG